VIGQIFVPPELRILLALGVMVVAVAGLVSVFLLAAKVYGPAIGILLGILTLIRCIGLIVLHLAAAGRCSKM
jgi:hypothetical protein